MFNLFGSDEFVSISSSHGQMMVGREDKEGDNVSCRLRWGGREGLQVSFSFVLIIKH